MDGSVLMPGPRGTAEYCECVTMTTGMRFRLGATLAATLAVAFAWVSVPEAAALTITPAAISFPAVTLNGAPQTVAGSTSAWRADATGETGGWNVTVTSTDLDNGFGQTIAVAELGIRLQAANIVLVSGQAQGPSSTQTSFAALSASPLQIASAIVAEGDGIYDVTPDFQLTVPAQTYTGSYTATVTINISVGP